MPNGSCTNFDKEAADTLCEYFQTVFTTEDITTCPSEATSSHDRITVQFDEKSVLRKLQHLKVDKSPGPDGIHPALLKNCASAVTKPLTVIFQESYYSGIVSNDWKLAGIQKIHHCLKRAQNQILVTIDQCL